MPDRSLAKSRWVVGLVLVLVAAGMFLFLDGRSYSAGAIAIGVIGLASIAISRRR